MPDVKIPSFSVPSFDVPKFEAPKSVSMPKLDVPAVPKFEALKSVSMPKLDLDIPSAPSTSTQDKYVEPQELRDARAAELNLKFKDVDKEAKAIEQKAKEARARANSAGQKFQAAKDDACSTRIGGKILCVRYGVGY